MTDKEKPRRGPTGGAGTSHVGGTGSGASRVAPLPPLTAVDAAVAAVAVLDSITECDAAWHAAEVRRVATEWWRAGFRAGHDAGFAAGQRALLGAFRPATGRADGARLVDVAADRRDWLRRVDHPEAVDTPGLRARRGAS